jgi:hypothetical protein
MTSFHEYCQMCISDNHSRLRSIGAAFPAFEVQMRSASLVSDEQTAIAQQYIAPISTID